MVFWSTHFILLFFLASLPNTCFFRPATADSSCLLENYTCGNITVGIKFPFYTNSSVQSCSGLHFIQCIDLVPAVRFYGDNYVYPVRSISYEEKTVIIHDLKLSSYFRGWNCDFVYDFRKPLPGFNFTSISETLPSGESLFNCRQDYDFSHDMFQVDYNLSLCKNYSLYYFEGNGDQSYSSLPSSCSSSKDLWFHWKLFFGGENDKEISLLGLGFSPRWVGTDCFSCQISARNCSDGDDSACSCSSTCQAKKRRSNTGIIIGASIAASFSVFITGCILCFVYLRHRRRNRDQHPKQNHSSSSSLLFYQSSNLSPMFSEKDSELACYHYQTHIFSYDELYEATNSFDPAMEVGDGGFGTVYKGKLRDGRAVAVKRLYESNFKRAEQFSNEIVILSRVRHQNLVSLYGCTSPRSRELVLVYEFVPNGTVADHIHGNLAHKGRLTWPFRLSIAVETATALAYLHAIDPPIIHRDVKTGNILLDAEFHVKVADFGLSRLFPPDGSTHISTAPQGTPGYLDPEYHQCYQLTDRSDVYSFGVVLVELISSKPAVDFDRDRLEINLSTMAMNRIQKGNLDDLMDQKLGFDTNMQTRRMMRLVAELAFRCLQTDREMRPSIKEVLEVLKEIRSGVLLEHSNEHVVSNAGSQNEKRPCSPESVTEKWASRSSTPNSSLRGS
ncbi:LEAF RUST 10 DISEASE-RESISTANCE LOCUS RECEPTOR-LIKE PROTEIN KINASE-like 1.1 [Phalaenopsis equestris]|uniref:LEAF RUST 10 DISEASE-RESISTANCE LOCUS RECEPTOR-LIKE PROTEIN KINASE-like 1.1 n=1 Tax=Phalaenopsis equestris TaxID=78828 RepID=UPI0009E65091|nr:LEAF RUST 10 DISEASE-RESISTANCE LOCUS RECEPTOR-LIKE PROTEIN KINASE-like 1.1 [Phalaenopsis equestris]